MKTELLISRLKTPDGTILQSNHTHDYVTHQDANGETYMLDGGNSYRRMSINKVPAEDVSIRTDSPFEEIRNNLIRYTYDGREVLLKDMSDEHLINTIEYEIGQGRTGAVFEQYLREFLFRRNYVL